MTCPECTKVRYARAWKNYSGSEKDRARRAKYEAKRIRVRIADVDSSYHVSPEKKDELKQTLAEFRRGRPFGGR